jgi:phosphatidylserine/phosphatidylglycerophosphate/cardiolipin synthase-like enzyme
VDLIQSAQNSVDISIPGFSSWIGCSYAKNGCMGCDAQKQQSESFPVFPALLNAVHQRNVQVRVLTNNYNDVTCSAKITPLDWLFLNGIKIRFYTTTTFTHSKYTNVDGKNTSISSINFSKTSFLKNREAGVVLGKGADDLIAFTQQVFENDWNQALEYSFDSSNLSPDDLNEIKSKDELPVTVPTSPSIPDAYVTPYPSWIASSMDATVFTSPDFSYDTLSSFLNSAKKSLSIMIYQVTDSDLCNAIIDLSSKLDLKLLVSSRVYDKEDNEQAQKCYNRLTEAGISIRQTPDYYTYSHQKFAIVDGSTVLMSTGNFSPSDYTRQSVFPPYGQSGWSKTNRDFTIILKNPQVVQIFQDVLNNDWNRGSNWNPNANSIDLKSIA